MWGCFLMSGVKILHFLKDWWKSIPIHPNYTMALKPQYNMNNSILNPTFQQATSAKWSSYLKYYLLKSQTHFKHICMTYCQLLCPKISKEIHYCHYLLKILGAYVQHALPHDSGPSEGGGGGGGGVWWMGSHSPFRDLFFPLLLFFFFASQLNNQKNCTCLLEGSEDLFFFFFLFAPPSPNSFIGSAQFEVIYYKKRGKFQNKQLLMRWISILYSFIMNTKQKRDKDIF